MINQDHITYRWIGGPDQSTEQDWKRIESVLEFRGWMSLNRATSRVLLVEEVGTGTLVGFFVLQLVPMTGPVWLHPSVRGEGIAEEMARQMWEFMLQAGARGWIAGGETAHGQRLCELYNMQKIDYPMYITVGMEKR